MDVDEENFNDDGAPIIENLSGDSTPEKGEFDEVLNIAREVTAEDPNFMDEVLLGQRRSSEGHRNVHEVFDRMSHLFTEALSVAPSATFNPNAPENSQFWAPEHNSPTPSPPHSSPPISVTEAGESHTSIPPTTLTSEVVDPKTTLPYGSYSEVNVSTNPIFSDSTTTSTTSSLNTSSTFSFPSTRSSFTIPSTKSTTAPSSTTTIPPPSTSGKIPPMSIPPPTSASTTFAGLSSNYDFLQNLMNQHECESYFGGRGFIGRTHVTSGAGVVPSVEELRRMSQGGSDEFLNRFVGMGQRSF
ncbi:hypothetical protein M5689_024743 [Euphorbia peplus]|nr:hypothetical protein M5689_024743 [Euphorbia peplus]